jgi:hypothetical protein
LDLVVSHVLVTKCSYGNASFYHGQLAFLYIILHVAFVISLFAQCMTVLLIFYYSLVKKSSLEVFFLISSNSMNKFY